MKFLHMITTALAGAANWDSWGTLSSKEKNKNTKTKLSSLHDEIVEMLTPPPSIFVRGHTVLDPSIPLFIHVDDAVPLFVFSSTIVPSFEDLLGDLRRTKVSFELSIHQQVVPRAHQVFQKFQQVKVNAQELVAAKLKSWEESKTSIAETMRCWIIEFMKANTTILPRYVWDWMAWIETIWQWRFIFQALLMIYRLSTVSTGSAALFLFPKALLATVRALNVPQKLFKVVCPQLFTAFRLLKLLYGFYKACRFLRSYWTAVRRLRQIRIRTVADAFRALVSLALRQIASVLWSILRDALLRAATVMLIPVLLRVLFR
jgi:hypothetical protein